MAESILSICDRRVRARPSVLIIYEHEIRKLAQELVDITNHPTNDKVDRIEADIRSGIARFRGLPIRIS